MAFDAGSAAARYDLDIAGFRRSLEEIRQGYAELERLRQGLKPPAPPRPTGGGGGGGGGNPAAKAEREARQLADSQVRLARVTGDYARALALVDAQLQGTTPNTARYNNLLAQQAQITKQAEVAGRSQLAQLTDIRGALVGMVSAFGVAQVASMTFNEVVGRAKAGFDLVSTIDATRRSIDIQLQSVRNTGVVYRQAGAFAEQYKLTQQQVNSALEASTQILRTSTSSTTDLLGVLSRLPILNTKENIEGAAFALKELQSGDITSIAERFNISRIEARRMKEEIAAGGDAVQIVGKYLDSIGVTMDALATRTQGATGKMQDLAVASEQINIALGNIATSKGGLGTLATLTDAARGLALVLNGDTQQALANLDNGLKENSLLTQLSTFGLSNLAAAYAAIAPVAEQSREVTFAQAAALDEQRQRQEQVNTVTFTAAGAYEAATTSGTRYATTGFYIASASKEGAIQALIDAKNKQIEADKTKILQEQTQLAADAFLRLHPQITIAGVEALVAAGKMDPLLAKLLEVEIQAGNTSRELASLAAAEAGKAEARQEEIDTRRGGGRLTPEELKKKAQADAANAAVEDAKRRRAIAEAQAEQFSATASTSQKLAAARAELAKLTEGTADYIRKQTEVMQLQRRLADERAQGAKRGVKDANAQEKADLALLEPAERLVALRQKLESLNPASVEYKKTLKEIRDIEEQIADEKERQLKSALDAQLAAIEDRKDRRKEEKELATARRVLASSSTSEEQKAAARDVLERIPLEQQKRALEIARQAREAGGVPIPTGQPLPTGALRTALPPAGAGLPPGVPALPTGAIPGGFSLNVQVLVDGKEVAAVIRSDLHGGVFSELRGGLAQAQSAGVARR